MDIEKAEKLLSKDRLNSYNGDIIAHFNNIKLIQDITPKLATIEICLRNLLDEKLSAMNSNWTSDITNNIIFSELTRIKSKEKKPLNHVQLLSRYTLGAIIKLIFEKQLQGDILKLQNLNFKKYSLTNRNYFKKDNKKVNFTAFNNATIALNLLWVLRNRSFHWENLTKTRIIKGKIYPRITTKIQNTDIGIDYNNITLFLNDLINLFDSELLEYC